MPKLISDVSSQDIESTLNYINKKLIRDSEHKESLTNLIIFARECKQAHRGVPTNDSMKSKNDTSCDDTNAGRHKCKDPLKPARGSPG